MMARTLLASLVLLLGCRSRLDAGDVCYLPHLPDVDSMPTTGVHVSGARDCVGCKLEFDDVILAIDEVPVRTPYEVYAALADERVHLVSLQKWGARDCQRQVRVRVRVDQLHEFGFAPVESLHTVSWAGRGGRLATRIGDSQFQLASGAWDMPEALLGTTYILLDYAARHDPTEQYPAEQLVDSPVPTVLLAIAETPAEMNDQTALPLAQDNPRVILASTVVTVNEWGFADGHLAGHLGYAGADVSVVDCHGVIRWSRNNGNSAKEVLPEAIAFAVQVERERQAGACWSFRRTATN